MRIVVDLNRCLGYAQCVPLAPEVLQLQGEEALAYDPNPDDSQRQQVARAVASCPVQAIIAEMDPPADRTDEMTTASLVDELVRDVQGARAGSSSSAPRWPGCAPRKRCGTRASPVR